MFFFMLQGSIKSFKEDEVTAAPILAWSCQDRLLLDKWNKVKGTGFGVNEK